MRFTADFGNSPFLFVATPLMTFCLEVILKEFLNLANV
jgi:hypothetical protein